MNFTMILAGALLAGVGGLVMTQYDAATAGERNQVLWAWWFSFLTFLFFVVDGAVLIVMIGRGVL